MISPEKLVGLLACPACRAPLSSPAHCTGCGLRFSDEDGTPRLIAPEARSQVVIDFPSERAIVPDAVLERLLCFPARYGPDTSGPYHLDAAHADVVGQLAPGSTILEVGCGGGQMRRWIESLGHCYVGIDISKTRVFEWLREYGGPDFLADAHFLPFRDAGFDLVYSAAMTEHMAFPHLVAREIARVLKPGGHYLGNCAFLEPWHDASFFHLTPLGVIELLTQAEFEIEHVWPGKGYSGYQALMSMGNRATRATSALGGALHAVYRFGSWARDGAARLRGREPGWPEYDAAKVAGAIDWIAHRR